MKNLIVWLSERKMVNYLVVAGYFAFVIFLHDPFVKLSVLIMNKLERHLYDDVVAVIFLLLLTATFVYFTGQLKKYPAQHGWKIFFLVVTSSLILIHTQVMFVMNIEIIHSFQYGILAALIFPLSWRLGVAVYWATLLGVVDEWYQYQILYPEKNDYFDFNDVVMNLLGAGMAAAVLYGAGMREMKQPATFKWWKSSEVISAVIIVAGVWVGLKFSFIQVYNDVENSRAWLLLSKAEGPESFWRALPASDIVYHVMQPLEGTVAVVLLLAFYFLMDAVAAKFQFPPKR